MTVSRILLLGKDGQVGAALQPKLASLGDVIAHGRATCDLANADQLRNVIRSARPDFIVNAAAYTAVDKAETDQEACYAINAIAPGIIAEEARTLDAWLVHYSTDYVFDGSKPSAYLEDDATFPLSVYGRSKRDGDLAIAATTRKYTILRVSWVYGLNGRNFAKTILKLAVERDELRIVADQFGVPTSAEFIADGTVEVARRILADGQKAGDLAGIFNLAPSGRISWHDYALELVRESKQRSMPLRLLESNIQPIPSEQYPTPAARPKNSSLDTGKIHRTFGLNIPDWRVHLKKFISELDVPVS